MYDHISAQNVVLIFHYYLQMITVRKGHSLKSGILPIQFWEFSGQLQNKIMFFLGTSVLEENKTFQCKDAKAYITTKTDSDFVIILSILLAGYISEGFVRNATQWQTELCLWKINYFDWIFKRHFNMVPLHITYEAWNAPEHSISHLASQENIWVMVEKYFTAFATTVFRWKKDNNWSGSQPSFLKSPSWAFTSPRAHKSSQIRVIILHTDA